MREAMKEFRIEVKSLSKPVLWTGILFLLAVVGVGFEANGFKWGLTISLFATLGVLGIWWGQVRRFLWIPAVITISAFCFWLAGTSIFSRAIAFLDGKIDIPLLITAVVMGLVALIGLTKID